MLSMALNHSIVALVNNNNIEINGIVHISAVEYIFVLMMSSNSVAKKSFR